MAPAKGYGVGEGVGVLVITGVLVGSGVLVGVGVAAQLIVSKLKVGLATQNGKIAALIRA